MQYCGTISFCLRLNNAGRISLSKIQYMVWTKGANDKLLSPETSSKDDLVFYGHLNNYLSA